MLALQRVNPKPSGTSGLWRLVGLPFIVARVGHDWGLTCFSADSLYSEDELKTALAFLKENGLHYSQQLFLTRSQTVTALSAALPGFPLPWYGSKQKS